MLNMKGKNELNVMALIAVSAISALLTALILLAYVLPTYYGINPIHTEKQELKAAATETHTNATKNPQSQAAPATANQSAVTTAADTQTDDPLSVRQDMVELTIPPKQILDYRLAMERDYDLDYAWTANGKTVNSELRGESADGKTPSKTFAKLTSTSGKGFFIIPFNGQFGWHWQNKTDQPITLRLNTKGHYQVVGQVGVPAPK